MKTVKNTLFVLAMVGLGFAMAAILSLKFGWNWGVESVPFETFYAAHVDGALIGLTVGYIAALLHMTLRPKPASEAG